MSCEAPMTELDCQNNGQYSDGKCHCEEGFSGATCEYISDECEALDIDCGENGLCDNGRCACRRFFGGEHCEKYLPNLLEGTYEVIQYKLVGERYDHVDAGISALRIKVTETNDDIGFRIEFEYKTGNASHALKSSGDNWLSSTAYVVQDNDALNGELIFEVEGQYYCDLFCKETFSYRMQFDGGLLHGYGEIFDRCYASGSYCPTEAFTKSSFAARRVE